MNKTTFKTFEKNSFFALAICAPLIAALIFFLLPDLAIISVAKLEIAVVGYCVALLGFFAGTRFGDLINGMGAQTAWIIPFLAGPIVGLAILLLPFSLSLAVLIAAFGGHGAWDSWASFNGKLPKEYWARRTLLTWMICLILIAIFVIDGMG